MTKRFIEALDFKPKASNYLYALCDFELLIKKSFTLGEYITHLKKFDVKILQYRDKINSNEIQIKNLNYLKKNLNIPIIINDKIELIDYADGIHLGQEDFSKFNDNKNIATKFIRKRIKDKLLGLSTHNELEILESNDLDIDMIGLGAYKATSTKDVPNLLGDKISYLGKISSHPVCAIGGVRVSDKIQNVTFNVVGSAIFNE